MELKNIIITTIFKNGKKKIENKIFLEKRKFLKLPFNFFFLTNYL